MKKLLITAFLSTMLLTGCSMFDSGKTIIKVNNQKITQEQFDKSFNQAVSNPMFKQLGIDKKTDKNSFLYLMVKDRVVSELIIKTLIDEETKKRHIKVTKKDTDTELRNIIDKIGSKEKFNEILKQNGISSAEFQKDLTEEVKMKKLVDMLEKVNISDNDAKKFYNENISKFKYPDKVRASHILVAVNPDEIKELIKKAPENNTLTEAQIQEKVNKELELKHAKAQKILSEVQKDPTNFAKLAREYSDDVNSAKQGGDLGFFAQQEMVEPFAKTAFSMKPNTVSNLVQTPYGYHIIMVTDRLAAGQDSYDKVKSEIKMYLENQRRVKILENFIETLKKNAKIEYVNPEYNPEKIKDALKNIAPIINESNQSATPVPQKNPVNE